MNKKLIYTLPVLFVMVAIAAYQVGKQKSTQLDVGSEQDEMVSQSVCDVILENEEFLPVRVFEGGPAPVDFSLFPDAKMYYTTITGQAAEGPNFAGHFTIAQWGCGTDCVSFVIIDAISGKIVYYEPPSEENGNALTYDLNSRLFVRNSRDEYDYYKGKHLEEIHDTMDLFTFRKAREYYSIVENTDEGYSWLSQDVWLNKICTENVMDGVLLK